ncbi:MAG: sensor histidine kinase [Desulfuromonas sp.]|nr:sensor histidine kinase [Desulfuromonas sp.]
MLRWSRVLNRLQPATLYGQMVILVLLVVLVQLFISGAIFATLISDISEKQIGRRALDIAQSIARMPTVITALDSAEPLTSDIQHLAESIRLQTAAEYIVVADHQGHRLSHPDPQKIGQLFVGGDENPALRKGLAYTSKAIGTLGPSLRGIVPVHNHRQQIIGFVAVGYLLEDVDKIIADYQREPATYIFMMMIVALLSASAIARFVKRQTLGLEPREIASLFQERNAILESIRAGIIAVDGDGRIRLINQAARHHTGLDESASLVGQQVDQVFAHSDFRTLLKTGNEIDFQELLIDNREMFFTCVPIVYHEQITGLVANFRPKEDLDSLTQELRQTREFTEMLRVQAHEYSNKLHTLSGLIQLEAYDEALELIVTEAAGYQSLIQFLSQAVPHPIISAIIMGKYNRARELKVEFLLDPESTLVDIPDSLSQQKLVTILGNLLDNALEAAQAYHQRPPCIQLFMTDMGNDLIFEIEDSGRGIDPNDQATIFTKGVSSKPEQPGRPAAHGVGLYLVKQLIDELNGQLTISRGELGGALFTLSIPKHSPPQRNNQ